MDLTNIPTEELLAVKEGRLSDVSTETLMMLRQSGPQTLPMPEGQPAQPKTLPAPEGPAQQPKKMGFFRSAWEGLKQGAFLGFGDELQSVIAASVAAPLSDLTWSQAYDMALEGSREDINQARKDNPLAYYPGEIAGAVVTGGAGATRLGGAKLATAVSRAPLRTAAAVGGGQGAVYGFGTGEGGLAERSKSAGVSGVTGALAAPAGAYVGSKIASGGKSLANFFKSDEGGNQLSNFFRKGKKPSAGRSLEQIVEETEAVANAPKGTMRTQEKAMDKIVKALKKDFPDDWKEVLEAWQKGDEPLSKVYGNRLASLQKGAAQYPSGKARADEFFGEQIASAPERLKSAISKNITDKDLYYATVDDIVEAGRAKARPLYDQAYKANKEIVSNEIDNVLNTPAGRKALKDTAKIMQNDRSLLGLPDAELKQVARDLAAIGKMDEVSGPVARGLNLRTLDAVKKNLDDQIRKLYRAGDNYEGGVLNNLKNTLVKALDEADTTGAYAKARAEAGDYLSVTKAMEDGKNFMRQDPELLGKAVREMTEAEKDAFKIGVGKQVRDLIDKSLEGSNPYNRIFGSKQAKERLYAVLSPDEFLNLEKALKAENRLFKLRNEVLGGSPTTSKAIAAAEMSHIDQEVVEIISGNPNYLPIRAIATFVRKTFDGLNDDMADAVARILYEKNPEKKLLLIDRAVGNKNFTEAEKETIKRAYFIADEAIRARIAGASGAAVAVAPGGRE